MFTSLKNTRFVALVIAIVVVGATAQKYALGVEQMNNLLIFRSSAWHLLTNANPYIQ